MLLVSYDFVAFLFLLLVVYYLIPRRFQWICLLAASYLFYGWGGAFYLLYPVFTTMSTWFLAARIGRLTQQSREKSLPRQQVKKSQRRLLILGLVVNFGILAALKYFNFVVDNVNELLGAAGVLREFSHVNWLFPLGISYYTFQAMGYLIDVYYRKYEPERSLPKLALFVSFFPQMVTGPMTRFDQMRQELFTPHCYDFTNIKQGFRRILWGYFKKLVVADRLGPAILMIVSCPETYDGIYVLLGMVGYAIWMYADFAGGMDIVLGAARLFGIRLPENFEQPFFSKSLAEFWRRWHITLMTWLREYVFFPMAGSRLSRRLAKLMGRKAPVYIASVTVWLIAGIWHGASWNFVAWGMANCLVMLISQELTGLYRSFHQKFRFSNGKGYGYFQIMRTFMLFCCLEMFEYYPFEGVFKMLGSFLSSGSVRQLWDGRFGTLGFCLADLVVLAGGILLIFLADIFQRTGKLGEKLDRQPGVLQYTVVFGLFILVLITGVYGHGYDASQFIYNQF